MCDKSDDLKGINRAPILRHYLGILLVVLRKGTKNLNQNSRCSRWDLNPGPRKNQTILLNFRPRLSVIRNITFAETYRRHKQNNDVDNVIMFFCEKSLFVYYFWIKSLNPDIGILIPYSQIRIKCVTHEQCTKHFSTLLLACIQVKVFNGSLLYSLHDCLIVPSKIVRGRRVKLLDVPASPLFCN